MLQAHTECIVAAGVFPCNFFLITLRYRNSYTVCIFSERLSRKCIYTQPAMTIETLNNYDLESVSSSTLGSW